MNLRFLRLPEYDRALLVLNGTVYMWSGWFGCQLESREWRRVPAGTRRTLHGVEFTVFSTERAGLKWRTTWAMKLPDNIDAANVALRAMQVSLGTLI